MAHPGLRRLAWLVIQRGLGAVRVWFVSWPELQTAMADGVLTITELATLPSLKVGATGSFCKTLAYGTHRFSVLLNSSVR